MHKFLLSGLFVLVFAVNAKAIYILKDLDFDDGANWEMVGVSLHNHELLPIQKEMGTFLLSNKFSLNQMKQDWNLELMWDDYCDYHYAFKFYRNKQLVKTVKTNLQCNYLTDGLYSFKFSIEKLNLARKHFTRIPWSKIHFNDMGRLRKAIALMRKEPNIYFYGDVEPYNYDGFFVVKTETVRWDANRDSMKKVVEQRLQAATGSDKFHVERYLFFFEDSLHISLRFFVYCDQWLAEKYTAKRNDSICHWRDHFEYRDPDDRRIMIMLVGIDRRRYYEMMGSTDELDY